MKRWDGLHRLNGEGEINKPLSCTENRGTVHEKSYVTETAQDKALKKRIISVTMDIY